VRAFRRIGKKRLARRVMQSKEQPKKPKKSPGLPKLASRGFLFQLFQPSDHHEA
jgi:hypothetical protein